MSNNQSYYQLYKDLKEQRDTTSHIELHKDSNVLLVDGLNTFIRAWSAIPTENEHGEHVGGVTGFLKSIGYAIRQTSPTRVVVVFDGKNASSSRKKIHSGYKEQRGGNALSRLNRVYGQLSDDEEREWMKRQLVLSANLLTLLPTTVISVPRVEADDVIGYISRELCPEQSVIMSSDKDFLQLVDDETSVWSPTKGKLYTPESIMDEFGIPSENFLMYRMIDGDKSDNVDGVAGLGLKTLLKRFPIITERKVTIDDMIAYASEQDALLGKSKKIKAYQAMMESRDVLERNKTLMDLEEGVINSLFKLKVQERFNAPISRLKAHKFIQVMMKHRMVDAMPNLQSWLSSVFKPLDKYADGE